MLKGKWGVPAYTGRPKSTKAASTVMLILAIILLVGFIKAGLREGWFEPIKNLMIG